MIYLGLGLHNTRVSILQIEFLKVYSAVSSFQFDLLVVRRVWRYQWSNQNPHIDEEQTTQWTKEKEQKDKQRSIKHKHKAKDRVTRTPLTSMRKIYSWKGIHSDCPYIIIQSLLVYRSNICVCSIQLLLLPNTNHLQHVADYVKGGTN